MKKMFSAADEKLTDKVFMQNLVFSVIGVLICIVALCSVTFAWFSSDVSSAENVIESSRFALVVKVGTEEVTPLEDGTISYTFAERGTYAVRLTMTGDSTASKGYCEIGINDNARLRTAPISKDSSIGVEVFEFTLVITEADSVVIFEPKWGIAADADIYNGGTVH